MLRKSGHARRHRYRFGFRLGGLDGGLGGPGGGFGLGDLGDLGGGPGGGLRAMSLAELQAAAAALPPHPVQHRQRRHVHYAQPHPPPPGEEVQPVPVPEVPAVQLLPPARRPFNRNQIEVHHLGAMNVVCPDCGAYHWAAERLAKSTLANPKFGMCCFSGKVKVDHLHDLPPELHQLYWGDNDQAKKFRKNIRTYNSALAFTSVGQAAGKALQLDNSVNDGHGPWLYRLHGELHHITGTLHPAPGRDPMYAQLYIYDPDQALNYHMNN